MCRMAGYVGPDAPLSTLLFDGDHSLSHQAYTPRELVRGNVNVDGTGIAWWDAHDAEPLSYVTSAPPWADPNLERLAPRLKSATMIAAVRSATPGMAFGVDNVSPFAYGDLAGSHNGWIENFRGPIGQSLIADLPPAQFSSLSAVNDSRVIFLCAAKHAAQCDTLLDALNATLAEVGRACNTFGASAALNLVLARKDEIAACRFSVGAPCNTLYVATTSPPPTEMPTGRATYLASEPLDATLDWQLVDDFHCVHITHAGTTISAATL